MKKILTIAFCVMASNAFSATEKHCDEIKRFRIWATGNDDNGIWIEFNTNPPACPGGFYLLHQSDNKDYVMSFLLAEKAQKNEVCIQAVTSTMIDNRCKVNYVYNP